MNQASLFKPNLESLRQHLQSISRERYFESNPESLLEIQEYIRKVFLSYGLNVYDHSFLYAGQTFSNLVARSEKNLPHLRRSRLIIGAHFDAVPGSLGADDNASGVAALLECARNYSLFMKQHEIAAREFSVEFVAFNLEENGMIGSQAYAEQLKNEGVHVLGMLSLEMIGYTSQEKDSQKMPFVLKPFYPNVGNFIALVGNAHSKKFLERVEKIFRDVGGLPVETLTLPGNGGIFPEARLSDHSPFWDLGFPALLITDTSFYRNPNYHTAQDKIITLDLPFLYKVTEAVIQISLLPSLF